MDVEKKYLDLFLWVVLGVIIGTGIYVLVLDGGVQTREPPSENTSLNQTDEPSQKVEEEPLVDIKLITYEGCADCESASILLEELKSMEADFAFGIGKIDEISHDSGEGKEIIDRYELERLPTLILSRNASEDANFRQVWESQIGTIDDDGTFVFREQYPPYYHTGSGSVVGFVNGTVISPTNCTECGDLNVFFDFLSGDQVGMVFSEKTNLSESDPGAQALIERYNITKLPVFILKGDAGVYSVYETNIKSITSREDGDVYVLREAVPPYVDLSDNHSIKGIIDVIKIVDSECTECFDVDDLLGSLSSAFGFEIRNESLVEVNTTAGSELVDEYNITHVPTVMISSDASVYPSFKDAWSTAGDLMNGWYIYRGHDGVADLVYRDLSAPLNESVGDGFQGNQTSADNQTLENTSSNETA